MFLVRNLGFPALHLEPCIAVLISTLYYSRLELILQRPYDGFCDSLMATTKLMTIFG